MECRVTKVKMLRDDEFACEWDSPQVIVLRKHTLYERAMHETSDKIRRGLPLRPFEEWLLHQEANKEYKITGKSLRRMYKNMAAYKRMATTC